MSLSLDEKKIALQLNFQEEVLLMLKENTQAQLHKVTIEKAIPENERSNFYLDEQAFPGRIIFKQKITEYQDYVLKFIVEGVSAIGHLSKIRELIAEFQSALLLEGYLLFATEYKQTENQGKAILIKSYNSYDILTIQLTNGANYNITNHDIVHLLEQWAKFCAFQIIGADFDWLELQFQTLPDNLNAFAQEIYEFCPNILTQGYIGESLSEDASIEDWEEALDNQTIEDLAEFLQKTKTLFLWWD
ncbi:DUF4253 domain-containing protein [Gloeothece verrucosa]|uniref:DUF4253 domain-containing protein n=1 Tax=Gloeothece verrucosa (strain PCC 7822) TaxID=497965 RepID=E0ULS5_GLOV7|nr:DUF4253 domain-containing protein [Gloeothece verrucosa]ADN17905.1 conserved hypothetical protein [Gloeothece verrucosa PCC 7822]